MTLMMISEKELPLKLLALLLRAPVVLSTVGPGHLGANEIGHPQFFFHPEGYRFEERSKPGGSVIKISFQQAIEFQQRLVIETHIVQLVGANAGLFEAVASGVNGKVVIVLDARETLFLGGSNNLAIDDKTCRRIVIES